MGGGWTEEKDRKEAAWGHRKKQRERMAGGDMGHHERFKNRLHFTVFKICLMLKVKTLCPCLMALARRRQNMEDNDHTGAGRGPWRRPVFCAELDPVASRF